MEKNTHYRKSHLIFPQCQTVPKQPGSCELQQLLHQPLQVAFQCHFPSTHFLQFTYMIKVHLCLTKAKNTHDGDYCSFSKFTPWCWVERPVPKADYLPPALDIAPKIEAQNLICLHVYAWERDYFILFRAEAACTNSRFEARNSYENDCWIILACFSLGQFLVVIFGTGSRLVKWYKAWWGGWVGKVVFPLAIRRANKELAATARNVWRSFAFIDIGAERWASDFFFDEQSCMVSYGFIWFHMLSYGFTWFHMTILRFVRLKSCKRTWRQGTEGSVFSNIARCIVETPVNHWQQNSYKWKSKIPAATGRTATTISTNSNSNNPVKGDYMQQLWYQQWLLW